ncbi:MAG TPA: hypothetical protein VFH51_07050 [Myxococcota bacterium]|nr:hypothetical protein [Myxococcota bacterium]
MRPMDVTSTTQVLPATTYRPTHRRTNAVAGGPSLPRIITGGPSLPRIDVMLAPSPSPPPTPRPGPAQESAERQPSPLLPEVTLAPRVPVQSQDRRPWPQPLRPIPSRTSSSETVEFCLVASRPPSKRSTLDLQVEAMRAGGLQRANTAPTQRRGEWAGAQRAAQAPSLSPVLSEGSAFPASEPHALSHRGSAVSLGASSCYSQNSGERGTSWGSGSLYRFSGLPRVGDGHDDPTPEMELTGGTYSGTTSPRTPTHLDDPEYALYEAALSGTWAKGHTFDPIPPTSPLAPKPLFERLEGPTAVSYFFQDDIAQSTPKTTISREDLKKARKANRSRSGSIGTLLPALTKTLKRTLSKKKG